MKKPKKYILILGDGMADYYTETPSPLMTANKPVIDKLAASGKMGMCRTVPQGFKPGSDVANLSILGYDPAVYYTGRSPLEALSMGIKLGAGDLACRCNLVTLDLSPVCRGGILPPAFPPLSSLTMKDYSAGNISTEEAKELIDYLNQKLDLSGGLELYAGLSYRHCLVERKVKNKSTNPDNQFSIFNFQSSFSLTPPHDIADQPVAPHLPQGRLLALMEQAYSVLAVHPINTARVKAGKNPANSIWFWGQGSVPVLDSFESKYGFKGAMISAVDLLKGIAVATKMTVVDVAGATADIDTDYKGMADAALAALEDGHDFVYLHIAAPDECAHHGDYALKTRAIELIDQKVVGYMLHLLDKAKYDYTLIIMPDHATPVVLKTHTSDPVPYLIWRKYNGAGRSSKYDEPTAAATGNMAEKGHEFLKGIIRN